LRYTQRMRIIERSVIALCFVCLLFSIVAMVREHKPLGEPPAIDFPSAVSQATRIELLQDDFSIINKVRNLPPAVLRRFTEKGGSRLVLADPNANFNPGDVIWDASVPQRRLIFAGESKDKCFVHYERGGRGHSYIIEVFELDPAAEAHPLWFGYCRQPANDLEKLRSEVMSGGCS
jgi:hypothetical protein